MEENMKENIIKTKDTGMEPWNGAMENDMKDSGCIANSMGKERLLLLMEK